MRCRLADLILIFYSMSPLFYRSFSATGYILPCSKRSCARCLSREFGSVVDKSNNNVEGFRFLRIRSLKATRGTTTTGRRLHRSGEEIATRRFSSPSSEISYADEAYMQQALAYARRGLGHTYPNPAVGCVLVREETATIVGAGFHPTAGYPHAEIFALLQAAGHVPDGVQAAQAVIDTRCGKREGDGGSSSTPSLFETVRSLSDLYSSDGGPEKLFENCLRGTSSDRDVTAYVTLEPCCHYGKTPPCAMTLALAGVGRVVVGFRDPNPRVDGGGVRMLRDDFDVPVDLFPVGDPVRGSCADVVSDFVKRITPRPDAVDYDNAVTGAMRRKLRWLANKKKSEGTMVRFDWDGDSISGAVDQTRENDVKEAIDNLELSPEWLERVDGGLWREELVLLRLKKAVDKKKAAKLLGERIASQLQAHVAQTLGHTSLLYRPGIPPALDLESLVRDSKSKD